MIYLNVEKIFTKFKENWIELVNLTEEQKEKYLNSLLNRVNINNPHYINTLPNFYFYNLVKKKISSVFKDIGFECKRCLKSCCYFDKHTYNNKEVGIQIYKEDYELLKNTNGDLSGYIIHKNIDINLKSNYSLFNRSNYSINPYFRGNFDYGFIDVIKRKDKYLCYYFDEDRRECKIHRSRPLVCFLFPFRFLKQQNDLHILYFDYCVFIHNMIGEEKGERFKKQLLNQYSYWEFWIAVSLYLNYVMYYGRDRKI